MSSQTQWWTLPDPSVVPPRGPPSTSSSNSVVDATGPTDSAPREPAIDVIFKTRWWTMPDSPIAPPGGCHRCHLQNSMADAAGPVGSALQGVRRRRRLQPRWWTLPNPPAAPPRGAAIEVLQQLVAVASIHCQRILGGTGRLLLLGVLQARHFARKFFWILAMLRTQRREIVKKISSNVAENKVYL
jgi:hypothetical protein